MKWLAATCVVFGALLLAPAAQASAPVTPAPPGPIPPESVPADVASGEGAPIASVPGADQVSAPLVVVPAGCDVPPPATVVFVGTLIAKDTRTARFRLEQVRAGSTEGYAVTDLIDIRYDDDVRFLSPKQKYLVGAAPRDGLNGLASKVRDSKALFGGNAVIGINDKTLECPRLDDPVRTLQVDGSPIESGILRGLRSAQRNILLAVLSPVVWAFGIIIVLVLVRWLFTAMFVVVRRAAEGEPSQPTRRDRRHHSSS